MGGIRTDARGQSPGSPGCSPAARRPAGISTASTGLGGNSVAETVVAGMIVGETMADFVESSAGDLQVSTALVREFLEREQARIDTLLHGDGSENAAALMARMQEIMTDKVGIFRRGDLLESAVEELQQLLVGAAASVSQPGGPAPTRSWSPPTGCRRC